MYHSIRYEEEIEDVKHHASQLFAMLQEPTDWHSPETIELAEFELNQIEKDYPELF